MTIFIEECVDETGKPYSMIIYVDEPDPALERFGGVTFGRRPPSFLWRR